MKEKAEYCLGCINEPCSKACPLENDIPNFIKCIKENRLEDAYHVLTQNTVLTSICGRICPHDKQCQGSCTRRFKGDPVSIGELEAYIGDLSIRKNWTIPIKERINKKVAVIGSGPSSLTCANFLYRNGIDVTIYEKYDKLGGILNHSIPDFRLDKDIVEETINKIIKGINIKYNMELGKNFSLEDIIDEYDYIYLGIGSNISNDLNIPGEELNGVIGGNELLEKKLDINFEDKTIIVNGGGNVAMDVARYIKRKNPHKVIVVYRRSENEMPAEKKEIADAKNENIEFLFKTNILSINGDNKVEEISAIHTELVEKENERPYPVNVEGTNFNVKCDYVIKAIGSSFDKNIINKLNIETKNGLIVVDEKQKTSNDKVYAGGDLTNQKRTIAWAARSGRNAAEAIIEKINEVS